LIAPFYSRLNFSEALIYFKENQFLINKRAERFGFIDFISNCGGLMGIFMGISLLSIAEILHHFLSFFYRLLRSFCCQNNRVFDLKDWILVLFFGIVFWIKGDFSWVSFNSYNDLPNLDTWSIYINLNLLCKNRTTFFS
jgi:hypothetical protein